jgi:hypothetical protein
MSDIKIEAKRLVGQLTREHQRLRSELERTEAALADAQRLLSHYEADEDGSHFLRGVGRAAPPGEAQREALQLMADGDTWTPAKLGKARGTSSQAAGVLLRRLAVEGLVDAIGDAEYQISSLGHEHQVSPPVALNETE